jgi:hypothetical protein
VFPAGSSRSACLHDRALLGWLNDARQGVPAGRPADSTGHLENEPRPRWPKASAGLRRAVVLAIACTAGWFPPRSAVGGTAGPPRRWLAGASGARAAPAHRALTLVRPGHRVQHERLAARRASRSSRLRQQGRGTPHDVDILDAAGAKVFDGRTSPAPPRRPTTSPLEAGTYKFECSIHPALMNGQLTVGG